MSFVMGTCAHIHVLDFGRVIAVGSPNEIQADPTVRTAYLGAGDDDHGARPRAPVGAGRRHAADEPVARRR